jgi:hypothetical protein
MRGSTGYARIAKASGSLFHKQRMRQRTIELHVQDDDIPSP